MCDCCKLWTVGCAVLVTAAMAGLNVGLGCGLGTETGVLLTGGCCFFLSESCVGYEEEREREYISLLLSMIIQISYSPYSKLNKGRLWRDYHRSRNQSDTWVALDSIHVPCWLDQLCVCVWVCGVWTTIVYDLFLLFLLLLLLFLLTFAQRNFLRLFPVAAAAPTTPRPPPIIYIRCCNV